MSKSEFVKRVMHDQLNKKYEHKENPGADYASGRITKRMQKHKRNFYR
jgi:hypothetical protein